MQVLKAASGIWWSRWFDVNNKDVLDIAEAYDSNRIPLDTFVIDMDVRIGPRLHHALYVARISLFDVPLIRRAVAHEGFLGRLDVRFPPLSVPRGLNGESEATWSSGVSQYARRSWS